MKTIKAVIFDLDGTLLNTIDDIADSMNASLSSSRLKPYSVEEYKYFVGNGVDELVEKVLSHQKADASLAPAIKTAYLQTYGVKSHDKTKPYEGIPELLLELNRQGIAVNVLSNKPDPDTQNVVHHYFPAVTFALVYGKKPGYNVKPDPRSVNEMIGILHLSKEEVLYVGDTYTDMMTAKNAGLVSVGVLWGFRQADELKQGDARYLIDSPLQILSLLKEGKTDDSPR